MCFHDFFLFLVVFLPMTRGGHAVRRGCAQRHCRLRGRQHTTQQSSLQHCSCRSRRLLLLASLSCPAKENRYESTGMSTLAIAHEHFTREDQIETAVRRKQVLSGKFY